MEPSAVQDFVCDEVHVCACVYWGRGWGGGGISLIGVV